MKISIISPAGIVDKFKLSTGAAYLESRSCSVSYGDNLYQKDLWTAGSPQQRCDDLMKAWCDPEIDVVMCARGGFGSIHLLDLLDWKRLAEHEKVLCGHSDITALHLAFMSKNIKRTVSGSMPAVELAGNVDSMTWSSLESCLSYKLPKLEALMNNCRVLKEGECRGPLVPVTLSVLCSLLGTGYMPDLQGAVLVVEDINEEPYRLDAYFSQLVLSGILESIGGLVYADFSDCGDTKKLADLCNRVLYYVNGPVIEGLPFGHCRPRLSLPVGMEVTLSAGENVRLESSD